MLFFSFWSYDLMVCLSGNTSLFCGDDSSADDIVYCQEQKAVPTLRLGSGNFRSGVAHSTTERHMAHLRNKCSWNHEYFGSLAK